MSRVLPIIEVNGQSATHEQLGAIALAGYGHFTAMQVRGHGVRGADLHLRRLDGANTELFGASLDGEQVRDFIRHALADIADASVRVIVQQPDPAAAPWVTVTVRPPALPPAARVSLQSVPYQRSVAHIKHAADFGQSYYGRLAERSGFHDALLTGPDGLIVEGSITNIGFFDGAAVVWPAAAVLQGVTMQLVQQRLALPQLQSPVRLADLDRFAAVFVTNSHGISAVGQIDDHLLHTDADFLAALIDSYESAPFDVI